MAFRCTVDKVPDSSGSGLEGVRNYLFVPRPATRVPGSLGRHGVGASLALFRVGDHRSMGTGNSCGSDY